MESEVKKVLDKILSRNKLIIHEKYINKLSEIPIAIVGIGGVGSVVAEQLVRLGAMNLVIVARGSYELGNINRQIPATYLSVISDTPKVYAMAQRLYTINPYINIKKLNLDVVKNRNLLLKELKKYKVKILFNCVDEYLAQIALGEISDKLKIPMIFGGVTEVGWTGILSVYNPNGNVRFSSLFKEIFNNTNNENIEKDIKQFWIMVNQKNMAQWLKDKYANNIDQPYPVIPPVPWIIASFEVVEFIKIIMGRYDDVIFFPNAIQIDTTSPDIKIVNLKNTKMEKYIPWRP